MMFSTRRLPLAAVCALASVVMLSFSESAAQQRRSTVLTGKIKVSIADDFRNQRSKRLLEFVRGDGKTLPIEFQGRRPHRGLKSDSTVVIRGYAGADKIVVPANGDGEFAVVSSPAAAVAGIRSVAIIRIASADGAVPCSASALANLMWFNTPSIKGLYETSSNGLLTYAADANGDSAPDVFDAAVGYSTSGSCDYSRLSSDATSYLNAAGINLSNWNIKIFIMPSNVNCGWAGLGQLSSGSGSSWIPGQYCGYQDVIAHEMGHNNGFHHAATDPNNDGTIDSEYGDTSCIMGYGGIGWREFNGPHQLQQGWIPSSQVVSPASGGTFNLSAIELPAASAPNPQVLLLPRSTSEQFIVSYREASDVYSSNLSSSYAGRINIHHAQTGSTGYSYLITALSDGGSYSDPVTGMTISMVGHGGGAAAVTISYGCNPAAPQVTISPAGAFTNLTGVAKRFDVSIKNADSFGCPATQFSLSSTLPAGWSGAFDSETVQIAPGSLAATGFNLTSPVGTIDGVYSFTLAASEPGHTAGSKVASLTIDTAAPGAVVNLAGSYQRKVTLSWTAPAGAGDIAGYKIYRGGTLIAQTAALSYQDSVSNGTYTYTVAAFDRAGNEGPGANVTVVAGRGKGKK